MKKPVIRQVKSLYMSCDSVGNRVLAKFSYDGGPDSAVIFPGAIVLWLLKHIPPSPNQPLPPPPPAMYQEDWDEDRTPRVDFIQCKQFNHAVRMTLDLNRKPDMVVLVDPPVLEVMRRLFESYAKDLVDLDAD